MPNGRANGTAQHIQIDAFTVLIGVDPRVEALVIWVKEDQGTPHNPRRIEGDVMVLDPGRADDAAALLDLQGQWLPPNEIMDYVQRTRPSGTKPEMLLLLNGFSPVSGVGLDGTIVHSRPRTPAP